MSYKILIKSCCYRSLSCFLSVSLLVLTALLGTDDKINNVFYITFSIVVVNQIQSLINSIEDFRYINLVNRKLQYERFNDLEPTDVSTEENPYPLTYCMKEILKKVSKNEYIDFNIIHGDNKIYAGIEDGKPHLADYKKGDTYQVIGCIMKSYRVSAICFNTPFRHFSEVLNCKLDRSSLPEHLKSLKYGINLESTFFSFDRQGYCKHKEIYDDIYSHIDRISTIRKAKYYWNRQSKGRIKFNSYCRTVNFIYNLIQKKGEVVNKLARYPITYVKEFDKPLEYSRKSELIIYKNPDVIKTKVFIEKEEIQSKVEYNSLYFNIMVEEKKESDVKVTRESYLTSMHKNTFAILHPKPTTKVIEVYNKKTKQFFKKVVPIKPSQNEPSDVASKYEALKDMDIKSLYIIYKNLYLKNRKSSRILKKMLSQNAFNSILYNVNQTLTELNYKIINSIRCEMGLPYNKINAKWVNLLKSIKGYTFKSREVELMNEDYMPKIKFDLEIKRKERNKLIGKINRTKCPDLESFCNQNPNEANAMRKVDTEIQKIIDFHKKETPDAKINIYTNIIWRRNIGSHFVSYPELGNRITSRLSYKDNLIENLD